MQKTLNWSAVVQFITPYRAAPPGRRFPPGANPSRGDGGHRSAPTRLRGPASAFHRPVLDASDHDRCGARIVGERPAFVLPRTMQRVSSLPPCTRPRSVAGFRLHHSGSRSGWCWHCSRPAAAVAAMAALPTEMGTGMAAVGRLTRRNASPTGRHDGLAHRQPDASDGRSIQRAYVELSQCDWLHRQRRVDGYETHIRHGLDRCATGQCDLHPRLFRYGR